MGSVFHKAASPKSASMHGHSCLGLTGLYQYLLVTGVFRLNYVLDIFNPFPTKLLTELRVLYVPINSFSVILQK